MLLGFDTKEMSISLFVDYDFTHDDGVQKHHHVDLKDGWQVPVGACNVAYGYELIIDDGDKRVTITND